MNPNEYPINGRPYLELDSPKGYLIYYETSTGIIDPYFYPLEINDRNQQTRPIKPEEWPRPWLCLSTYLGCNRGVLNEVMNNPKKLDNWKRYAKHDGVEKPWKDIVELLKEKKIHQEENHG